jgi:hypothetical protein
MKLNPSRHYSAIQGDYEVLGIAAKYEQDGMYFDVHMELIGHRSVQVPNAVPKATVPLEQPVKRGPGRPKRILSHISHV